MNTAPQRQPRAWIKFLNGPLSGNTFDIVQQVISIGRDITKNDVVISEQCVSDLHMQIVREGERYVLIHPHPERQETTNGLLYQGRKIQGNEVFRSWDALLRLQSE